MANNGDEPAFGGEGSGKFHIVQPLRDLESNWAVDLAKNLEEYLLKICSGEISGGDDALFSINFAEAALLLQGSIQVYSRKVEYLYSLVLQALEFISQKSRTQDQEEGTSVQAEASSSRAAPEDDDEFWCPDDIPVEAKNNLDSVSKKDAAENCLVKPPANLVVVEGDCLDSSTDGGELETYLLATNYLYRDFILLDPCDATVLDDFLKGNKSDNYPKGSSLRSKGRKSFLSPTRASGGTTRKSSARKNQNDVGQQLSPINCGFDGPPCEAVENDNVGVFQMDDEHDAEHVEFNDDSYSDDEDPWKPLNPHEPGNLKVKPFKKVVLPKKPILKKGKSRFPLAKLEGPVSVELMGIWKSRVCNPEKNQGPRSPTYFEKLRESLVHGENVTHEAFHNPEDENDDVDDHGFEDPSFERPEPFPMDEDTFHQQNHDDFVSSFDNIPSQPEDPPSQATLEDLCRSHLDALLASIAESEQQTEMAARVSSWKQRIEDNLEEQDSHPPFDIHEYGERILDKLCLEDGEDVMSFADIVKGQEKHDIARTFSSMLQLVNDRKIDLDKRGGAGEPICYTSVNPFYVQLLSREKRPDKRGFVQSKKRPKSPVMRTGISEDGNDKEWFGGGQSSAVNHTSSSSSISKVRANLPQHKNGKLSKVKIGKQSIIGKHTPESKRRRRSRLVETVE